MTDRPKLERVWIQDVPAVLAGVNLLEEVG